MNQKITLLLYYLLVSTTTNFAQTFLVTGTITDSSDQPIEFANILIQNKEDNMPPKGTITAADGTFQLELTEKATYEISISFIGFTAWQKTLSIQTNLDLGLIQLISAVNKLEAITVRADRNIITRKEDKLIFNVATSPLNSGYDGLEVLQRSPNVLVDSEGNILMRNEAPTIMINGRITNLSGAELANYLSTLQSDAIQRIEIQTHLSANTDAESSGGLLNIILKKKPVGFDASMRSDYTTKGGGFENAYTGITFNYGAAKWNIYGSTNYLYNTNEHRTKSTTDYFVRQELISATEVYSSNYKRPNYQLGFVSNLANNHEIGIEGFATTSAYGFDNLGTLAIFNQENLVDNGEVIANANTDNQLYTGTFNYAWTIDTLKSNFKIFADYANQQIDRTNRTTSSYLQENYTDNTERNNSIANTLIYAVQADVEKYFPQGLKLESGIKWTYTDRENTLLSDIFLNAEWNPTNRTTSFNYTEQVAAGYAALNKKVGDDNFVEIGLRLENTELQRVDLEDNSTIRQNYTNWFPAFYFSRDLPKNRTLSLSYSKRLRRPPFQFLNNNVLKINDFRYELGNPDLIPENVHNVELSLKEKKQSLDLYLRRTTQAINGIYYLEGQIAYYQKFNEGIQQQIGLSYNRFGNLFSWWYIKALVSVYQRKFINEGGTDSFKRTTARLNLSNTFKLNETTNFDLIGSYISPSEDAYYIAYARYRVNAMLQKTFLNKQITTRIYVNDVFNTLDNGSERPFTTFKRVRYDKWRSRSLRLWVSYRFNGKNKINKRKNQSKNEARRRL